MNKFWEGTAGTLSTQLLSKNGPALVFWVWALTIWAFGQGGWSSLEDSLRPWFSDTHATAVLALTVAALIVVTASTLVVERLTLPVLRALEGYWPSWCNWISTRRIAAWRAKADQLEREILAAHDAKDEGRLAAAQTRSRALPTGAHAMPTRIGNIIRAGERRPYAWYGLDPIIVWPQLWLVLPEQPRTDLAEARSQLDRSVTAFTWALLSGSLGILWPPAVPVSLLVAVGIWWWWIPNTASAYATLLSAVFDTYRFTLYDALHYPRPTSPASEPDQGRALTRSLWIDTDKAPAAYTPPDTAAGT